MSSTRVTLLLLAILAAICLPAAYAIKCWQCNSATNKFCEQVPSGQVVNDTSIPSCLAVLYKECPTTDGLSYFCRKQVQTIKDQKRIIRGCGSHKTEQACYMTKTPQVSAHVCQCFEDGCNGAPSLTTSFGLFTILAAFAINRLFIH